MSHTPLATFSDIKERLLYKIDRSIDDEMQHIRNSLYVIRDIVNDEKKITAYYRSPFERAYPEIEFYRNCFLIILFGFDVAINTELDMSSILPAK